MAQIEMLQIYPGYSAPRNGYCREKNMLLLTVNKFRDRYFAPDCRPDPRTVRGWVERGEVAGKVMREGGRRVTVYIDAEAWEAEQMPTNPARPSNDLPPEIAELVARAVG